MYRREYTHSEYRRAKVVHFVNLDYQEEYYYKRKMITKKEAIQITRRFFEEKELRKMKNN